MSIRKVTIDNLKSNELVLVGIPFDAHSTYMRGPEEAPQIIRQALISYSANMYTENGTDLSNHSRFCDVGDIEIKEYFDIEKNLDSILNKGGKTLSLGGDHSVTFPVIKAYAKKYPNLTILHFDSHPDLYDNQDGEKLMHGCPFARIMENGLAKRLVQVGIRTLNNHQKEQAEKFGVEIIDMKSWTSDVSFNFDGPVYISFDMDVLDPAFAPGISHHEPGGFSTREVLAMIQKLDLDIVGADVVEFNPKRDINSMTAMTTAKIVKEIASKILEKD